MSKTDDSFWESLGWQKYGDHSFSRLIETNSRHIYSLIYNENEARWLLYDSRSPMRPCREAPASNPAMAFDAAIEWIDAQGFLLKRDKVEVAMAQPDRSLHERTVGALESMATSFASFASSQAALLENHKKMLEMDEKRIANTASKVQDGIKDEYERMHAAYEKLKAEYQRTRDNALAMGESFQRQWDECHNGEKHSCKRKHYETGGLYPEGGDMSDSKLYRVEARIIYYAYAECENDAEGFLRDAINDSDPEARAWLIENPKTLTPTDGWDRDCLVYHDGLDDITLGQVIDGTVPGDDE